MLAKKEEEKISRKTLKRPELGINISTRRKKKISISTVESEKSTVESPITDPKCNFRLLKLFFKSRKKSRNLAKADAMNSKVTFQ